MKLPFLLHRMLIAGILAAGISAVFGETPAPVPPRQQTALATGSPQTPSEYTAVFPSPVPGLPIPMDLKSMEGVTLETVHIDLAVRQHEVFVISTCTVNCDPETAGKKVTFGIPFLYSLPDADGNASSPLPIHRVPFSKSLSDISIGVNQLLEEWQMIEGGHPQAQAPSMNPVQNVTHWLTFSPKLKPGSNTLTQYFAVPYLQTRQYLPQKDGGQVNQGTLRFDLLLDSVRTWGKPLQQGEIRIFSEEMLPSTIQLVSPQDKTEVTHSDKGVIQWKFASPEGKPIPNRFSMEFGPTLSFRETPDGNRSTFRLNNTSVRIPADYKVETSSCASTDPFGNPSSPDNLKPGSKGFWAEGINGNGELQFILLTFPSPQKLEGLLIQPGISPVRLARNGDVEAGRHPDVAFSIYNRPRALKIILNDGQYEFKATLRDDWNEQLITVPYFNQPVKSVKIVLDKITSGTGSEDTYMTSVIPLVK